MTLRRPGYGTLSVIFLAFACIAAVFADLHVRALDPWSDLREAAAGFFPPDFSAVVLRELALTVAFAVIGVGLGASVGLAMSFGFSWSRGIRLAAASMRSIHELFWALLLLQITGISPWTGVLAVAIPYSGIFAKVFSEIMEEADFSAERVVPNGSSVLSRFAFARVPTVADAFKTYTLYRLECGLRSSLILGFIGIPTIGDAIKSAFRPGSYHEAAALLMVFYLLIATRGLWARTKLLPVLVPASIAALVTLTEPLRGLPITTRLANFVAALTPAPLRTGKGDVATWLFDIVRDQIGPGLVQTLVLSHLAATLAALFALATFPLISQRFNGRLGRALGRTFLILVRGTPDYMFAYLLLQLLGLSMLPAVLALGIHNGGIIAFLMGRHADTLAHRRDAPRGFDLYAYETLPRLFGQFVALVLYRYEIIVRESAILGTLSIYTLGFYVIGAMDDFKLDTAFVLLVATGLLSLAVDATSRALRRRLGILSFPTSVSKISEETRPPSEQIDSDTGTAGLGKPGATGLRN